MSENISLAVSKRPVVGEYAYPSVRLRVETDRAEPFAVRLVESLPPGVDETDVGFHADEGYEHWSVTGEGEVVYENVVGAETPATTLYGIAEGDRDQLAGCMGEPAVEVAETAEVEDADWTPIDEANLDVTVDESPLEDGDSTADDSEPSPTDEDADGPETTMEREDTATTDAQDEGSPARDDPDADPARDGESAGAERAAAGGLTRGSSTERAAAPAVAEPDAADGEAASEPAATPTEPEPRDSVVEQFAAELRRDEPSTQAVATLRSHLARDTAGSVDAKLDHCMTRIGELDAYVDALEAFLDEEGTAEQLLAEVRDDIRALEARVDDVDQRVEAVERAQSRLDDRLATVEDDLDAVAGLDDAVDDLDERVSENSDELDEAVAEVEDEIAALGEDVESVEQWRSAVVQALSETSEAMAPEPDAE